MVMALVGYVSEWEQKMREVTHFKGSVALRPSEEVVTQQFVGVQLSFLLSLCYCEFECVTLPLLSWSQVSL